MEKMELTRKDKLIEAALDEFTEKTFDEASLNNILKRAGISKGSFYYHFKNKQELYLYIFDQAIKEKLAFLNKEIKDKKIYYSNKNIFEILSFLGKAGLKFAAEYPKYYQFALRFYEDKNEEVRALAMERAKANDNLVLIDALVKKAIENKELRDDFPIDFINKLLIYLLTNFHMIFMKDFKGFDLEKIIEMYDMYLDFIENGLGKNKLRNRGC